MANIKLKPLYFSCNHFFFLFSKSFYCTFYLLGTTKGYYLYIETSSPRKHNETARLSSITFRSSGQNGSCYMRFWYHMFGKDVDTLSIKLRTSVRGALRTIWNKTGNIVQTLTPANQYFNVSTPWTSVFLTFRCVVWLYALKPTSSTRAT